MISLFFFVDELFNHPFLKAVPRSSKYSILANFKYNIFFFFYMDENYLAV